MPTDWLSPAQCFGYLAFVLGVASFLQTNDRRFKQLMIGECLAYVAHFALLGNPTAVASSVVSVVRSALALRTKSPLGGGCGGGGQHRAGAGHCPAAQ